MDRSEFDPERDLQNGPYPRRGFTEELQKRIEERIERKSRSRRLRITAAVASISAACAIAFLVQWHGWSSKGKQAQAPAAGITAQTSAAPKRSEAASRQPYNSGLLLGLRTDFERKGPTPGTGGADSSYRTIYIAPLNGKLDIAAEGKGILLPYGKTFWRIDAVMQTAGNDVYRTLIAHPADLPVPQRVLLPRSSEQVRRSERLLFAGNKYVTLEQNEVVHKSKRTIQTSRVWVKELRQVNGDMTLPTEDNQARSYVGLQDLFGTDVTRKDEWAIVRKPGAWVPSVAATTLDGDKESYTLRPFSPALPNAVISHDQLCCTWAEIQRIQPDAVDALSSPKKDFIAIITPSSIYFNEVRGGKIGATPQLTINLNDNEKLVMSQWATGSYVEEWVKASRTYLQKP